MTELAPAIPGTTDEVITITVPVIFTVRDVQQENWPDERRIMVQNLADAVDDAIGEYLTKRGLA